MSLKIYLLRHGETEFSQTGNYCGDLDAELTPEGLEMAKAFADAYKTTAWEAVYVSPMKRAIATAQPLCDAIGVDMVIRPGLKEIAYGEWEGQTLDYVKQNFGEDYQRWRAEPAWNAPTGGETSVQIANRSSSVITEIHEKYRTGNVLVVSHKATIRIMLCSMLGIDLGRYRDRINVLTTSITIIKLSEHGPMLEVLGDRHHIPEHIRNRPGT